MIAKALRRIVAFLRDQDGPTSVEYAVVLMLIFLAVLATVQIVGGAVLNSYGDSKSQIEQATQHVGS